MPRISEFYGITILMFFGDHNPPHFHVRDTGHKANFALDGSMLAGDVPRRAARLVMEWVELHPDELEECWERAVNHEPPGTIDPLPSECPMVDITDVEVLHDRVVRLRFSDGEERVVDLAPFLWGPAFEGLAEEDDLFAKVKIDSETGTIAWPNGADLDPDVLHGDFAPAKPAPAKS